MFKQNVSCMERVFFGVYECSCTVLYVCVCRMENNSRPSHAEVGLDNFGQDQPGSNKARASLTWLQISLTIFSIYFGV